MTRNLAATSIIHRENPWSLQCLKAGEEEPEQNIAAINDTAEKLVQYQEPMHPDIMADVRANVAIEKRQKSATTA